VRAFVAESANCPDQTACMVSAGLCKCPLQPAVLARAFSCSSQVLLVRLTHLPLGCLHLCTHVCSGPVLYRSLYLSAGLVIWQPLVFLPVLAHLANQCSSECPV
jgi:hypothetical protein